MDAPPGVPKGRPVDFLPVDFLLEHTERAASSAAGRRGLLDADRHHVADVAGTVLVAGHDDAEIVERLAVALISDERLLTAEIGGDLAGRGHHHISILSGDADRMADRRALVRIVDPARGL